MINPQFTYRTKQGSHKARFYSFDGKPPFLIHGAINIDGTYFLMAWDINGKSDPVYSMTDGREFDLVKSETIEVKEKATVLITSYPAPLPQRIVERFYGKRVKISLEEI